MLWWQSLILIEIVHNFFGFLLYCVFLGGNGVTGWEGVNPVWIYNHCRVNAFGAVVLCLLTNSLCPIASIAYWFYKLCTVGRR